ncbi:hypothetical protein I3843_03G108200 [Carya illinoinensis]|uniref:Scarecrow-like protein 23 n=1 Tax=Carya illinoinensis TaxID=32201 RepID=A0A922FIG9_CARIL|nr:hypothetical protein I3760_03G105700 [Carya illinoinensis]KAG6721377.1 hypothetical protein I3842_03G109200 [Carya illinoinensis]KAG7986951.1 hypothetical protein I3843_03G108200 [Carya illinoinensis]
MLQSLVPQSPISNPSNSSAMKSKRVDRDESYGDDATTKRMNFSNEASVSGEKTLDEREEGESTGLKLLGLLLQCAESVALEHLDEAADLLPEIAELSSPYGSSPQRVGAYFAHALHARVITSYLGTYWPLSSKTRTLTQSQKIFSALQSYNSISPLVKFSHFTANQAIFQALDGEEHVHVIDLDIMQGLQWPGLFHILASRNKKIRSMRVTGFGSSSDLLESTGKRLGDFAIVVHWMHHCLYDITGSDLGTLKVLALLRPKLITIVEQDLSHGGGFLARFVEALHYYSALFDALGDGLGEDNLERHMVEQQLFGCEIRNIMAVGGPKRTGEEKVERWGEELRRVGFQPISLGGNPAAQASLLLGMFPWKGYTLVEDNGCLKLGWKDLSLLTASAWQPSN